MEKVEVKLTQDELKSLKEVAKLMELSVPEIAAALINTGVRLMTRGVDVTNTEYDS